MKTVRSKGAWTTWSLLIPRQRLSVNKTAVVPGDPLQVGLTVGNAGPAIAVDVYFAVVLPAAASASCPRHDGLLFFADAFARTVFSCLAALPGGLAALAQNVTIPAGLPPTVFPAILSFIWPEGLPAGTDTFAVVFLRAGTLDVVAIASQSVGQSP